MPAMPSGTGRALAQLTDWLAHVPKEVLAKNFHTSEAAFDRIPGQELYIFPGRASLPLPSPSSLVFSSSSPDLPG